MSLLSTPSLLLTLLTFAASPVLSEPGQDCTIHVEKTNTAKDERHLLPIFGKVIYDKERIEGCKISVFQGNELIHEFETSRSGKYEVELEVGYQYMFHFEKEGYLNKMFAVDAENGLPKDVSAYPPFVVNVIMIPIERFEGVEMDHLEFPFALVRYSKRLQMFDNDPKYTQQMTRALAAAMLQAGRLKKD